MDWREIPSLAALRAFEAAARHGSFSAAARDLNVTHAAVAQHVRGLEEALGARLLDRSARGVAATAEGAALADALSDGFGRIAAGVRAITERASDRPLRVTLTPSFAESWLMPRMGDFWARHPEVALAFQPSVALVDPGPDGPDMAIRFGRGAWPGLTVEPLLMAPFAVVAAPGYLAGDATRDPAWLQRQRWVFSAARQEQRVWGQELGLDFDRIVVVDMPTNGMALASARAGHALTIQAKVLVEEDLRLGRLVALAEGGSGGMGYFIAEPQAPALPHPRRDVFRRWLKTQV